MFSIEKDAGKLRNHGEGVYNRDICIFTCSYKLVPS